tara:strand:+ start:1150 stop:1308 length:159 start_codon:yes stop_codon:yes gene_type:complete
MASSVLQGVEDTARECVSSMNTAIDGVVVTNTFAQGIIKVGSSEYRYYFIYN